MFVTEVAGAAARKVTTLTPLRHGLDGPGQKDGLNQAIPRRHYVCYIPMAAVLLGIRCEPLSTDRPNQAVCASVRRSAWVNRPLPTSPSPHRGCLSAGCRACTRARFPGMRIGASEPAIRGSKRLNRYDERQQRKEMGEIRDLSCESDRTRLSMRSSSNRRAAGCRRMRKSERADWTRTSSSSSSRAISRPSATICDRHTDSARARRRRTAGRLDGSSNASMSAPGC